DCGGFEWNCKNFNGFSFHHLLGRKQGGNSKVQFKIFMVIGAYHLASTVGYHGPHPELDSGPIPYAKNRLCELKRRWSEAVKQSILLCG
ncbi:hypothetical protein, partial [Pedobacter petrophilus]|uniref:hypothetical protein n=1 Tax=Pedobacter petrophilus TaxID=1908241 RepID=UPI001AE031D3